MNIIDTTLNKLRCYNILLQSRHFLYSYLYFPSTITNTGHIQASAYEKQMHATIACVVTKFRAYRRVESRMPPTKYRCGGMQ